MNAAPLTRFPIKAGVLLGVGLGGFFDGIVLHQILQWHHMASSAGYPPDNLANLKFNLMLDGFLHAVTWLFTVAGLAVLWRHSRHTHFRWPGADLPGAMLVGFGAFNLIEGLINHQLLGLHHVQRDCPARSVDSLGYWLPGVGRSHDRRRLVHREARQKR